MRTSRLVIIALIALPVAALTHLNRPTVNTPEPAQASAPAALPALQATPIATAMPAPLPPLELSAVLNQHQTAIEEADLAMSEPAPRLTPWQLEASPDTPPGFSPGPDVEHATVITIRDINAFKLAPGDTIELPLPDGRSVSVSAETHKVHDNLDYTWTGHIDGDSDNPVIATAGSNQLYISMNTREGSYSIRVIDGKGWVFRDIMIGGDDGLPAPDSSTLTKHQGDHS